MDEKITIKSIVIFIFILHSEVLLLQLVWYDQYPVMLNFSYILLLSQFVHLVTISY